MGLYNFVQRALPKTIEEMGSHQLHQYKIGTGVCR